MALQYITFWYKTCMQQTTKRVFFVRVEKSVTCQQQEFLTHCWDMVQNTAAWSFGQIVRVVLDHPKQVACLRNKKKLLLSLDVIARWSARVVRWYSGYRVTWSVGAKSCDFWSVVRINVVSSTIQNHFNSHVPFVRGYTFGCNSWYSSGIYIQHPELLMQEIYGPLLPQEKKWIFKTFGLSLGREQHLQLSCKIFAKKKHMKPQNRYGSFRK